MIEPSSQDISNMDAVQPEMVRILTAKSEAERLKIALEMWRSAYRMVQKILATVERRMSHGTLILSQLRSSQLWEVERGPERMALPEG